MFFLKAAMQAVERFGVSTSQLHLDSSSFSVDGDYPVCDMPEASEQTAQDPSDEQPEFHPIRICRGYSRDQRPDLKQYMLNLICVKDGGVPLWLNVADGNQSDGQTFAGVMSEFSNQWHLDGLFVIDAAFYSEPNLKSVSSLRWLSRVPQTLKQAKTLIEDPPAQLKAVECDLEDYKLWETRHSYAGIEQRWIVIESQTRKANQDLWAKELQTLEKQLNQQLKKLSKMTFACKPDAYEALLAFEQQLELHQISKAKIKTVRVKGEPGEPHPKTAKPEIDGYRISATLQVKPDTGEQLRRRRSRFILASNELDEQQWPAQRLLEEYKQQQKVERGFRFLKDPLFFTSSVFVKKPERVEALALVMALTLLVYTLAERKLRQALEQQKQTVLDQRKRPTAKPTFRWIMQKFQGIHLATVNGLKQITNFSQERQLIVRLLGPPTARYYLVTGSA